MNYYRLIRKLALLLVFIISPITFAATGHDVQARIDEDIAKGNPIVVHLIVALCDNVNQGIVRVPEALGNGQDPRSNLYWGALYGVKTHLPRKGGWQKFAVEKPENPRILERMVLHRTVKRGEKTVPVYIVADAWDGAYIRESLQAYLQMSAGNSVQPVEVRRENKVLKIHAGGLAHLVAFVGHNGLMDFSLKSPSTREDAPPRSALILACASKPYFMAHLQAANAHPLLLTTGLMAPEAYTLDSAIHSWVGQKYTEAVIEAAAGAYHKYQQCGIKGARRLFWGEP